MRWISLLFLAATPLGAETVVATQTIRPQQIITADAVRIDDASIVGAVTALHDAIGQEARMAIYPGRAVMVSAIGAPALVDRNQAVELVYAQGGLRIKAEGRALGRGAAGDRIRVMNVDSRLVLYGRISTDGTVLVGQ